MKDSAKKAAMKMAIHKKDAAYLIRKCAAESYFESSDGYEAVISTDYAWDEGEITLSVAKPDHTLLEEIEGFYSWDDAHDTLVNEFNSCGEWEEL